MAGRTPLGFVEKKSLKGAVKPALTEGFNENYGF